MGRHSSSNRILLTVALALYLGVLVGLDVAVTRIAGRRGRAG